MMLAMARQRVDLRLPEELVAAIDVARGDVTRTRFIERALEAALVGSAQASKAGIGREQPATDGARVAASPRASLKPSHILPIPKGQ